MRMNTGSIEDRLLIRELLETFATAAMRGDPKRLGSTWSQDGVWKLPSMTEPAKGRDAIIEAFGKATAYLSFMSMISVPTDLVIEGDTAHGKAYCQEIIVTKTNEQKMVVGCYDDTYVRREGRWYFQTRTYEVIGKK
jgi:uncharacterized protein (TIGR02246 family)